MGFPAELSHWVIVPNPGACDAEAGDIVLLVLVCFDPLLNDI